MKTNPRRIPRTQADVDKAKDKGQEDGFMYAMLLAADTLLNDFEWSDARTNRFFNRINAKVKACSIGSAKAMDYTKALKEEHDWELKIK